MTRLKKKKKDIPHSDVSDLEIVYVSYVREERYRIDRQATTAEAALY